MRWLKLAAVWFISLMAAFAIGAAIRFAVIFSKYPEVWPWPNAVDIGIIAFVSLIMFIVACIKMAKYL